MPPDNKNTKKFQTFIRVCFKIEKKPDLKVISLNELEFHIMKYICLR